MFKEQLGNADKIMLDSGGKGIGSVAGVTHSSNI